MLRRLSRDLLATCHRMVDLVTMLSAVFGVMLYFAEGPSRREAHDTSAWQILALQQDRPGNGGRRWAMEVLAADGVDLHGVHMKDADFSSDRDGRGAELARARLDWSALWRSNLKGAHLRLAHLSHASLACTVLREADLSQADLSSADLSGADVTAADFTGARVAGARLARACVDKGGQAPRGLSEAVTRQCPGWNDPDNWECRNPSPDAADRPVAAR